MTHFQSNSYSLVRLLLVGACIGFLSGCIIEDKPIVRDSEQEKKSNYVLQTRFDDDAPQDEDFDPRRGARPHDPITQIKRVKASEADSEAISDDELVLAIELNGESRAYPVVQLCGPKREIINDNLGGQAIAATW